MEIRESMGLDGWEMGFSGGSAPERGQAGGRPAGLSTRNSAGMGEGDLRFLFLFLQLGDQIQMPLAHDAQQPERLFRVA